jgi:hypothetical protein
MKTSIRKLIVPVLALCALIAGTASTNAQVLAKVDPSAPWIGYINIFQLPADGGA